MNKINLTPFLKWDKQVNVIKITIVLMFFIICAGCGPTKPVGHDAPGLDELKKLCKKDAGLTINKSVEAEGYYDASRKVGALRLLIPSDYNFTEYCNLEPNITSLFDEPGCWHLTKVSRETGLCDERVDKSLWKSGKDTTIKFREKNCIAVNKIEKPTARYRYEIERKEWWLNESVGTKMTWGIGRVVNNETEEIIGTGVNYVLYPKRRSTPPSINCGTYLITGKSKSIPFAAGLIEKTLVPRTDKKAGESQ